MRSPGEPLRPQRVVLLIVVAAFGLAVGIAVGLGVKPATNSRDSDSSAPVLSSPEAPKVVGLALGGTLPELRPTSTGHVSSGTTTSSTTGTTTGSPATTGTTSATPPTRTQTTPQRTTTGGDGGGGGG